MLALVVDSFGKAPTCQDLAEPEPGDGEVLVDVVAAGLHPRVRSQADGSHYTGSGVLPLVPGIDGVGRAPDGTLRYFVLPDTTMGAMAERTVVDLRRSVVLPEGSDPVTLAAGMNPAMSSWVALRRRIAFERGWKVLVLGATGNAGRMAIEVSRHLGADDVRGAPNASRSSARSARTRPSRSTAPRPRSHGSWGRRPVTSTSSSTICGASPRPAPWPPSSGAATTGNGR